MYTKTIFFILLLFSIHSVAAQEGNYLINEGFSQGILPSGWSASKGSSINLAGNIVTDDLERNLPGNYGVGLNTQGYYLQMPEISSCGVLRFSFRGSNSPSNLGFKVQKMSAGSVLWEDVVSVSKPISGNKENMTLYVNEPKRTTLRFLLHDRTANTLYLDNISVTAYINPNLLDIKTDFDEIDFGNCTSDSTLYLKIIESPDSIEWLDVVLNGDGFQTPLRINLKESTSIPIKFIGSFFRNYESILELKIQNKSKTIPLRARKVSSVYMTLLTDLTYGEEHPQWIVQASENNGYYLLGTLDSLFLSSIDLSNGKALEMIVNARTYNGTNRQYLSVEGRDSQGNWSVLAKITPESATMKEYTQLVLLNSNKPQALRFTAKDLSGATKIGIESITLNGAFGNALSVSATYMSPIRITRSQDTHELFIHSEIPLGCLKITDLFGRTVLQKVIPLNSVQIQLSKGIYIVTVNNRVVKVAL